MDCFSQPSNGFILVKIISSSLHFLLLLLDPSCHFNITLTKKESRVSTSIESAQAQILKPLKI